MSSPSEGTFVLGFFAIDSVWEQALWPFPTGIILGLGILEYVGVQCQVPGEAVEADSTDTTMLGTASLLSFSGLLQNMPVDAIVKVVYKYMKSKASHSVVIGPSGFQLCSSLQALMCGLPCRHIEAAFVTELKRTEDFQEESTHPH